MSATAIERDEVEVDWDMDDIDDICEMLVDRHGVDDAKRRAFQVASRLKMLHPEEDN